MWFNQWQYYVLYAAQDKLDNTDRQHNGQKKKDKPRYTKHDIEN